MEQNIFTKIMNVIENNTDMPKLEKDIEDWKILQFMKYTN